MDWGSVIYFGFSWTIKTVIAMIIILLVIDYKNVINIFKYYKRIIPFYRRAGKWKKSIDEIVTQEDTMESYSWYIVGNLKLDSHEDERCLMEYFLPKHNRKQPRPNIVINITVDSKNPSLRKALIKIPSHYTKACDINSFHNMTLGGRKLTVEEVKKRKDLLRKDFKRVCSPKPNVVSVSERASANETWNTGVPSEYLLVDGGNQLMNLGSSIIPKVLDNADEAGIERMVLTCSSFKEIKQAIKLCEQYPHYMYFTAGVHPSNVEEWNEDSLAELEKYAKHPQCRAIGECGLKYPGTDNEKMIRMFRQHIELARKLRQPLWFCSYGADFTMIPLIREYQHKLKAMCVTEYKAPDYKAPDFKKFPMKIPHLWEYLEMGCFVSVSSISKEAGASYSKTWFKDWLKKGYISPHQIILTSNAPSACVSNLGYEELCEEMHADETKYLQKNTVDRYKSNSTDDLDSEPGHLPVLLETVASCMDCPPKKLASACYHNAQEFFGFR